MLTILRLILTILDQLIMYTNSSLLHSFKIPNHADLCRLKQCIDKIDENFSEEIFYLNIDKSLIELLEV